MLGQSLLTGYFTGWHRVATCRRLSTLLLPLVFLLANRTIGYYDQAYKLMSDLKALIDAHESAVGRDYEARLTAQHEARQQLDDLLLRHQADEEEKGSEVQQNESSKRD